MALQSKSALIIGVVLVVILATAYAVYDSNFRYKPPQASTFDEAHRPSLDAVTPPEMRDHHIGSIEAEIKLVVFTDFECPFCRQLHQEGLPKLQEKYGDEIVIAYRNLPLTHRFEQSRDEAIAAECVATLSDEESYWNYVDRLFEINPSRRNEDVGKAAVIAAELGVDPQDFSDCKELDAVGYRIDADLHMASHAGISATPSTVVMVGEERILVVGSRLQTIIDTIDTLRTNI